MGSASSEDHDLNIIMRLEEALINGQVVINGDNNKELLSRLAEIVSGVKSMVGKKEMKCNYIRLSSLHYCLQCLLVTKRTSSGHQ